MAHSDLIENLAKYDRVVKATEILAQARALEDMARRELVKARNVSDAAQSQLLRALQETR